MWCLGPARTYRRTPVVARPDLSLAANFLYMLRGTMPEPVVVKALDKALWQAPEPDWLPHGTKADGDPDWQPIWLATDDEAPNGARFLFLVEGGNSARVGEFDRVFDLFDGNRENEVAAARLRWTSAKAAGHTLAYWQQDPKGWAKKA